VLQRLVVLRVLDGEGNLICDERQEREVIAVVRVGLAAAVKQHAEAAPRRTERLDALITAERAAGLDQPETYADFGKAVAEVKCRLLEFLIAARREGRTVVGYGAPAKGNTLLNYCGVGTELLPFTVDLSPHKQGRYLPGVQIPIYAPQCIFETRPDYVLVLPWNLKDEIRAQMAGIRDWGGRFVVAIPTLTILD